MRVFQQALTTGPAKTEKHSSNEKVDQAQANSEIVKEIRDGEINAQADQIICSSLNLDRIKADPGNGSDVNIHLKMGTEAKAEIYGIENSPASDVHATMTLTKDNTNTIIVSDGKCVMLLNSPAGEQPFLIRGEFLVNDSLRIVGTEKGKWNGKKAGAKHTIHGKVMIFNYIFVSDDENPLVFEMTSEGYKYINGKGNVKDLKTGKVYIFK